MGDIEQTWELLASDDQSEGYDVDMAEIRRSPDGLYHLRTASGCSCWDGYWDDEAFGSLNDLYASALRDRDWPVSPARMAVLRAEVEAPR